MKRTKIKDRVLPKYTKGEEIFNMTSHIVGAVLGIVTTVLCIVMSASHNSAYGVVSSSIYGATMIILYTMSIAKKKYGKKSITSFGPLHNIFINCRFIYPNSIMCF